MNDIVISRESKDGWNSPVVAPLVAEVYARRESRRWSNRVTRAALGVAWFASVFAVSFFFVAEAVAR